MTTAIDPSEGAAMPEAESDPAGDAASTGFEGAVSAGRTRPIRTIVATIEGVKFVTVPLAHYLALVAAGGGAKGDAAPVSAAQLAARVGSPIYLDPEVADFLYAEVGRMTIDQARVACAERFDVERTPSKSAIHRYWQRVRRGLDNVGGKEAR